MKLNFNPERLGRFCRERGIARLELFGSALRADFRAESDVDLLATLRADAHPTLLDWAEMQESLAELFGRPVATNTLTGGQSVFSDPQWTNYPNRYYRLRSP